MDKAEEIHRPMGNEMGIVMGLEDRRNGGNGHALVLLHVHLPAGCQNISTLQTVPGWEVSPLVTSAGNVKEGSVSRPGQKGTPAADTTDLESNGYTSSVGCHPHHLSSGIHS